MRSQSVVVVVEEGRAIKTSVVYLWVNLYSYKNISGQSRNSKSTPAVCMCVYAYVCMCERMSLYLCSCEFVYVFEKELSYFYFAF